MLSLLSAARFLFKSGLFPLEGASDRNGLIQEPFARVLFGFLVVCLWWSRDHCSSLQRDLHTWSLGCLSCPFAALFLPSPTPGASPVDCTFPVRGFCPRQSECLLQVEIALKSLRGVPCRQHCGPFVTKPFPWPVWACSSSQLLASFGHCFLGPVFPFPLSKPMSCRYPPLLLRWARVGFFALPPRPLASTFSFLPLSDP